MGRRSTEAEAREEAGLVQEDGARTQRPREQKEDPNPSNGQESEHEDPACHQQGLIPPVVHTVRALCILASLTPLHLE